MCMFDSNKRLNSHPINLVCATLLDMEGQTVDVNILLLLLCYNVCIEM